MLNTSRTSEQKLKYVRGAIAKIGICDSVKAVSTTAYDEVFNIVTNHPEATAKLKDIEDFYIKKNPMGKGFTLMIKKTGGGEVDVSYIVSAMGKGPCARTVFHACLRVSIDPQIRKFKDGVTTNVCAMCTKKLTKDTGREADHIKYFADIVNEFILMQPGCTGLSSFEYPTETKECNDGTYRYRLTDADSELEAAFKAYHKKEASLQLLCRKCNRTRGGPKRKAVPTTAKNDGSSPMKRKATTMAKS